MEPRPGTLTEAEIEKLLTTAGKSRNPVRDRLLLLLAYRHALRVSELVDLRADQFDLVAAQCAAPLASNSITDCAAVWHIPGTNGRQHDKKEEVRGWGGVMTKVDWRIQCL